MTWKEFKEAVEAQDVKDDDTIWYIDVSFPREVEVSRDDACGTAVTSIS